MIDCNRAYTDPTSILALSDGEWIPGNHELTEEQAMPVCPNPSPYHQAIDAQLQRLHRPGVWPALISIHSFTHFFDELHRPWEIGVL